MLFANDGAGTVSVITSPSATVGTADVGGASGAAPLVPQAARARASTATTGDAFTARCSQVTGRPRGPDHHDPGRIRSRFGDDDRFEPSLNRRRAARPDASAPRRPRRRRRTVTGSFPG